jgi:hypothetical protein
MVRPPARRTPAVPPERHPVSPAETASSVPADDLELVEYRDVPEPMAAAEAAAFLESIQTPDMTEGDHAAAANAALVAPVRAESPTRPARVEPPRAEPARVEPPARPAREQVRSQTPTPAPSGVPQQAAANGAHRPGPELDENGIDRGATAPQLRRFIKSRAYVPMHELRRRFAINGHDDEVTAVDLERHRVFVGLPDREGRLLAELLRGGDIGYELSLDPISPIVVGVYPMRPVTRA